MHIKRHCQFLLDKEKGKTDAKVRYRIKWDGNTKIVAFSIGFRVDIDKWSSDTQRCKNNTTHGKKKTSASIINKRINEFETACEQAFIQYEKDKKIPTKEEFKNSFNVLIGKESAIQNNETVAAIFQQFIDTASFTNQWSSSTKAKMNAVKNKLTEYNPEINTTELNEDKLLDFTYFLLNEKGLRNITVKKIFSQIRWFARWAVSKNIPINEALLKFNPKLKTVPKKVIFLEWDELMKIYNFNFTPNQIYLERVRDVFCFCCFTSLRYSDTANLTRANVFNDYLSITSIKTNDNLKIELNDYSKAILQKYEGEDFPKDLALPIISNQKMNDYLKDIGELCELNEPITITYFIGAKRYDEVFPKYALLSTHAGRRTFICNALILGIPPNVVMKWTGHSDYKAMQPYIDVADRAKREAMQLFNRVPQQKNRD